MKKVLQQGFTLVELMIAMLLGIVLLLGVMQVLISTSSLGTTSNNLSVNQDTARTVLNLLGGDAHRAGYSGCGFGGELKTNNGDTFITRAPIMPIFTDGFGVRFSYGIDSDIANSSGAELLNNDGAGISDCLGKQLYYRSYSYYNCTNAGRSGICIDGYNTPAAIRADVNSEFIEGVTIDKIVFTVPTTDRFRGLTVDSTSSNNFSSANASAVQDVLSAKLVTFYISVKNSEPRSSSAVGESKNTIERRYSGSYPLKNLGND